MAYEAPYPFSIPHETGNDYATWFIKQKTDELVGHFGVSECDREDIEQELALDLIRRWPKFDPERAQPRTFIARVVRNRISTIIRHRMSEQRRFEQLGQVPINRTIEEEVTSCFRTGRPERIDQEYVELEHDVNAVLAELPPELREIGELLRTKSRADVARELGISESTLRYRIEKLRSVFEEAGFRDCL